MINLNMLSCYFIIHIYFLKRTGLVHKGLLLCEPQGRNKSFGSHSLCSSLLALSCSLPLKFTCCKHGCLHGSDVRLNVGSSQVLCQKSEVPIHCGPTNRKNGSSSYVYLCRQAQPGVTVVQPPGVGYGYAPPMMQPGQVVVEQVKISGGAQADRYDLSGVREFKNGFCDCFGDCGVCTLAFCSTLLLSLLASFSSTSSSYEYTMLPSLWCARRLLRLLLWALHGVRRYAFVLVLGGFTALVASVKFSNKSRWRWRVGQVRVWTRLDAYCAALTQWPSRWTKPSSGAALRTCTARKSATSTASKWVVTFLLQHTSPSSLYRKQHFVLYLSNASHFCDYLLLLLGYCVRWLPRGPVLRAVRLLPDVPRAQTQWRPRPLLLHVRQLKLRLQLGLMLSCTTARLLYFYLPQIFWTDKNRFMFSLILILLNFKRLEFCVGHFTLIWEKSRLAIRI